MGDTATVMIRIILFSHDGILMNNGDGDDDDPGDTDKYHEYHDPNEYHDGDDPDDQELLRPGGLSVFLPDLSLFSRPLTPPHSLAKYHSWKSHLQHFTEN